MPLGVQKVTSVEGITEYTFPNGLHALLFPDSSQAKITVNAGVPSTLEFGPLYEYIFLPQA